MRSTKLVAAAVLALTLVAADAPKPAPLTITRQERSALLGLSARAELVRLRAQQELAAIGTEQAECLDAIAARLGIAPAAFLTEYAINADTLAVTRQPKGAKP